MNLNIKYINIIINKIRILTHRIRNEKGLLKKADLQSMLQSLFHQELIVSYRRYKQIKTKHLC